MNVATVTAGHYHTLAIDGDNRVWAWGWGIHGQLGLKSAENAKTPVNIALLNSQKAVKIAAGYAHSVVLSSKVCISIHFYPLSPRIGHLIRFSRPIRG